MMNKVYTGAGILAVVLAVTAVVAFTLLKNIGGVLAPPLTKHLNTFIIRYYGKQSRKNLGTN